MYLALGLSLLVLFAQILGSLPTANLTEMVWQLWTSYAPSQSIRQLRAKRNELMKVRQERSNTSSQDEFAKWARLDRQHQKLKKEYDDHNTEVGATRQRLTAMVRMVKWCLTKGSLWIVQWFYRREAVVWLPYKALPHRVEWFLSLPSAPIGSISAVTWVFATDNMIKTAIKLFKRLLTRRKAHDA